MSVEVDANVGVSVDGGVVKLIDSDDGSRVDSINLSLSGGTSTRIGIFGDSVGDGEVEVTARGIGAGTGALQEMRIVSVTVSTPILVITGVSPSDINLLTREETVVTVSVRAEAGAPSDVMLIAMIDEDSRVAEVSLMDKTNVGADTTARFIVTGLNVAGETTLTLTASHIDYEPPESIEVPVDVDLRSIELSADPSPLEIVSGMSAELTITATPTVTITIISDDDDTASVADSAFMLMGGAENSTEINVSGGSTGTATLMIEASMAGYTTEIVTVSVEVLDPLLIKAVPATFDLTEGENIQINVNPNLIRDDVTTVTISIEATTGTTGLTVSASSLEFTDTMSQLVTVTATDDGRYTGDRDATLTLTATGYATETVTIRILDNDLVVTVTEPDGGSLISVDEGSDVELVINVDPPVPDLRNLDVNLSYTNITGTPETISITVPAGRTSQSFSIPAGDDEIAAQATRTFNVLIEPDISSYAVGASSSVAVSVLNEDSAVVSIFALSDRVDEGTPAQFEVQVSNEIAVSLAVTIVFTTTGGDFGIDLRSTNVVIAAGNTTALLTVRTAPDEVGEAYGSLTAEIVSLAPEVLVSGVQPTRSDVSRSAMATILDDDLSVRITTLDVDDQANTTVSESDNEVSLRLVLSAAINRDLQVNLSYAGDLGLATGAPSDVVVPASSMSQSFSILVDDDIAAQSTRIFNVLITPDINYAVGTPSSVAVSVLDDDVATVSILSLLTDSIEEGTTALFEVQVDKEIAVDLIVGIALDTTGGDFELSSDRRCSNRCR